MIALAKVFLLLRVGSSTKRSARSRTGLEQFGERDARSRIGLEQL